MSEVTVTSASNLGTSLQQMLVCDEIQPGAQASYEVCKIIYVYHPLGAKMADTPIKYAQSQPREISIPAGPETRVRDAFLAEWNQLGCDHSIANLGRVARVYGIGSIVMGVIGKEPPAAFDPWQLSKLSIFFNVLDPLNTSSGMGTMSQDPNSPDFQRPGPVTAGGKVYHVSRSCVLMNEDPLFIEYTSSAFGFSGRSIYQRALFPLKTFVQTMITDEMVTRKSGVLVAMIKQVGSAADKIMAMASGFKRSILKEAKVDNVISIGGEDKIESLDLVGIPEAAGYARKNALENTAVAADMPAMMLNSETFAQGLAEGSEDAKTVARYVDDIRNWLNGPYRWMDNIVQYRAWTPEFYATIQADFPEYKDIDFKTAFMEWRNAFAAKWPSLLIEPDSEKIKVEDVKQKAIIAQLEVLLPEMDPENKVRLIKWAVDTAGENKMLFPNPLDLDYDALEEYVPPTPPAPDEEPGEPAINTEGA